MANTETINIRPPVWLPIVAVVIGGAFYLVGKNIEVKNVNPPGTITVSGEGKSTVTPNIAQINFGLDTGVQTTSQAAMSKLSTTMNDIYDALQKAGIDKKDIATSNFSLNPSYDWTNGKQTLNGYQAVESFTVKVRDLTKTSGVVSAATDAGANQAGGVSFTVEDPSKVQADARAKAITQAKQKAQTLAQQLGVHLGAVKGFTEGGGVQPPVPLAYGMGGGAAIDSKAQLPVPSGDQDVTVDVSITYELD
ncbi:MAG TPA: SIMPL domain-containing protein [Candidatus Peribacteraceae bacterium]|nr:SIMPL domain-containing protein [Candidatus Peribacteraceae bacterium]